MTVEMPVVVENTYFYIPRLEAYLKPSLPPDEQAKALETLSTLYRTWSIASLLSNLARADFQQGLQKSAQARVRQLQLVAPEAPGYFQRASRIEPFCDALAAGQDELAENIASLSPKQYLEGEEFEEEFCYARMLFALLDMGPSPQPGENDRLDQALTELETILDGNLPRRVAVCKALADRDGPGFHTALLDLIEERDLYFQKRKLTLISDIERNATEEAIFVEGLALLRLAARIGITSDESYRFMPDIARFDR